LNFKRNREKERKREKKIPFMICFFFISEIMNENEKLHISPAPYEKPNNFFFLETHICSFFLLIKPTTQPQSVHISLFFARRFFSSPCCCCEIEEEAFFLGSFSHGEFM
jgi:hypothetical protein